MPYGIDNSSTDKSYYPLSYIFSKFLGFSQVPQSVTPIDAIYQDKDTDPCQYIYNVAKRDIPEYFSGSYRLVLLSLFYSARA